MLKTVTGLLIALVALSLPATVFGGVDDGAVRLTQSRNAVEKAFAGPLYRELSQPLVNYSEQGDPSSGCGVHKPRTFAILIGVDHALADRKFDLKGAENDVDLISAALVARFHSDIEINRLEGPDATRERLRETLTKVLSEVECHDRVVFYFAGHSTFFGFDTDIDLRQQATSIPTDDPSYDHAQSILRALDGRAAFLLWGDDATAHPISAADISEFISNVRNRHADITVVLDGAHSAAAALLEQQRDADPVAGWSERKTTRHAGTALLPDRGDFAAYYSSLDGRLAGERVFAMPDGSNVVHGDFSFAFAEAVQDSPALTARGLAERLQARAGDGKENTFNSEGSNPNMLLFDPAPSLASSANAILISAPEQSRGPAAVKSAAIEVRGTVNWGTRIAAVLVDGEPAVLDRTGAFSRKVTLVSGINTVRVVALTQENLLLQKSLDIVYAGDVDALKGTGRSYAVIIANAAYGPETGFNALETPVADADALEAALVDHYGFVTKANLSNGSTVSFSLRNASGREIAMALYNVSQVVGADDTVLIYYAGHGIYEPLTTTAFWVPIDAVAGLPPTYLSASTITEAIDRIQARKLVLISDSCFSGALMRSGPAAKEEIDSQARVNSLLALSRAKSRLLISSGNNEPVSDTGGYGHSIFAQALLKGLADERYDEFSARELFDGYILTAVTANSKQEPQFRPLENVGHEGGDVIFVRSGR